MTYLTLTIKPYYFEVIHQNIWGAPIILVGTDT